MRVRAGEPSISPMVGPEMHHRVDPQYERLRYVSAALCAAFPLDSARGASVQEMCEGVSDEQNEEHLVICPSCGQVFDCRDKDQLEHHESEEHAPKLAAPRRSWFSRLFTLH